MNDPRDLRSTVFISYAREDERIAGKLRDLLTNEGWDVWWDRDLYVGAAWESQLLNTLSSCGAVVALWSKSASRSSWVLQEMDVAIGLNKLLPCILDRTALPRPMAGLQWATLIGWRGGTNHESLPNLFAGLERKVLPSRIDTVRPGFDLSSLGEALTMPSIPGVGDEFPYLHFSVVMNPGRRLAWYVASEVRPQNTDVVRTDVWSPDPTLSRLFQPTNDHFSRTGFDRGHLISPNSITWGERRQGEIAMRQAFYWTNTAPQTPQVNRTSWLSLEELERHIARLYGVAIVFGGPVLADDDPPHVVTDERRGRIVARQTFRLPRSYWKVIAWVTSQGVRTIGFQVANTFDPTTGPIRRGLKEIEALTGLVFPRVLSRGRTPNQRELGREA